METIKPENAYIQQVGIIQNKYPEFKVEDEEGRKVIKGFIILEDSNQNEIDRYAITIKEPDNFPFRFPLVYETGGRIPRNIDWHVYETDGHCCIKAFPEEILICKNGISLEKFIEEQLKPYFYNQLHRENFGYYLNERTHGPKGNVEFFEEVFHSKNILLIIAGLEFIRLRHEPNRVQNCFCGSGTKYRKCHRETFRQLSVYSNGELEFFINYIKSYYLKNMKNN